MSRTLDAGSPNEGALGGSIPPRALKKTMIAFVGMMQQIKVSAFQTAYLVLSTALKECIMSKLPYIINDIKEFVHVPLDRHRAVLLRVKDIETRRGNKRVFNPVLFSKASPKGGIPFWVETPHIGPKIKDAFAEAHKALKMKALMHLQ